MTEHQRWDLMWGRSAMLAAPLVFALCVWAAREGSAIAWYAALVQVWPIKCLLMMAYARLRPGSIGERILR